jgi:hypothetical protein
MTLDEKIFAHHTLGGCPIEGITPGDVVRVSIEWIIASELTWSVSQSTIIDMKAIIDDYIDDVQNNGGDRSREDLAKRPFLVRSRSRCRPSSLQSP